MNKKIDRKGTLFYAFLLIYGVAIIYLAAKLNIWQDEGYSLITSSHPLSKVVVQSYVFEGQPPFYFLLLSIWRHIDPSIFFARLLSVIFLAISAVYFYKLLNLVNSKHFSRWVLVLYLLNPFLVWAGMEIRLYSLIICISCMLIYSFIRFFFRDEKKFLYLFLFSGLIGVFTQYFICLELVGLGVALLILKDWKHFLKYCIYCTPLMLLFIPNLFFITHQIELGQINDPGNDEIFSVIYSPQSIALGLFISGAQVNIWVHRVARLALVIVFLIAYFRLYRKDDPSSKAAVGNINIFMVASVSIYLLYIALVATLKLTFEPRYMALMVPCFIFLYTIFKSYNLVTARSIYIAILCLYVYQLFLNYRWPIKTFDYAAASSVVHNIERPEEPIVLYNQSLYPAFSFYYKGPDSLYALPKYDDSGQGFYFDNIIDTTSLKKAISEIPTPSNSYILMSRRIKGFMDPINMDDESFTQCLRTNYNITYDTIVPGVSGNYAFQIRRLEIKKQ